MKEKIMNWLKQNWFKLAILIILIWVGWYLVKYLDFSASIQEFKVENYTK